MSALPGAEARIAALTAPEVAARLAAGAAVLLPMGSLETHGPALPMGDYLIAEEIALRIAGAARAAGADALVAPAIPFGGEDFFAGVPGSISLPGAVLQAVIEEMAGSFLRAGTTRRLLMVNGHAGNIPAAEAAARALRQRHGAVVPVLHVWRAAGALHAELGGDPAALGHGGDPVASVALHLRPDLCRPEAARPRQATGALLGLAPTGFGTVRAAGVEFAVPMQVEEVAPGGVQAPDPRGASAAHGARLVERLVAAGVAMLQALRDHAP
ncbi:creatinine amidohydrolase [Caldovatus sediminis]|uniref:Creatinine amidohydrolase n=1 Tax=Caldovatus sediminis TaxID=2041189 RepID=A0A8J2Z9A1_9PROT|nr:creatininase family protein [Caldovatus sediminis]GGG22166.1 creatinine amidohydrolase [Caldovatus sediminis]